MPATCSTVLVFKAQKDDEIRRLSVAHPCLQDVSAAIAQKFALSTAFKVVYVDDENERVTVASDEELLHALSILPPGTTLKLIVQPISTAPATVLPAATVQEEAEESVVTMPTAEHETEHETPKRPRCSKHRPEDLYKTTFLEGTKMPFITEPGAEHRVCLHVENSGERAWPENSFFRFVRGDNFFTHTASIPIKGGASVQPGEAVTIEVPFSAPAQFGRHAAVWRLSTLPQALSADKPAQGCYGSPVRIITIVRRPHEQRLQAKMERRAAETSRIESLREARQAKLEALRSQYSTQLAAMKDAGVEAREERLLRMLGKFDGDAQTVMTRLQKRRDARKPTI